MDEFTISILPDLQCIEAQGVRYSFELFRNLGLTGFPEGTYFKIIERENGMITIERYYPTEEGRQDNDSASRTHNC